MTAKIPLLLAFFAISTYLFGLTFAFMPYAINYKNYAIVNFTSSAFTLPIQISNTLTLNAPTAYTYINASAINATLAVTPYQYVLFQGYNTSGLVGNVLALPFHNGYLIPNQTINGKPYNSLVVYWNYFYPINTIEANASVRYINTNISTKYYILGNLSYSFHTNYIANNNNITTYEDVLSFQSKIPYELLTTSLMPLYSDNGVIENAQIQKLQIDYYDGKPFATHKLRYVVMPQASATFSQEYLVGIDTFYSNNVSGVWQYSQNVYFGSKYLIAANSLVAYANYSVQNATTSKGATSGVFYNGNPYAYTLYNYQQINIKQPPLTTPYTYYLLPAYSQGYTFTTNTITNATAPQGVVNLPTFAYYYNITNINWTMPAQDYYQNAQYYQNPPLSYSATILMLTLPHYAQLDTDTQACGNIQVKAFNSQNTFLGYVNVNLLNYNTSVCNYVIANQTLNTKTAYAKLQILFGANPNIASQLNSSYKPFAIYSGSGKASASTYNLNEGVLLLKHFIYANDSFLFAGQFDCGATYPCYDYFSMGMSSFGIEKIGGSPFIPHTFPSLITFNKLPSPQPYTYLLSQITLSPYVWGYIYNNSYFHAVNQTTITNYTPSSTGGIDVLNLSENSSAIWLPYYTLRYNLSAPQSITSTTSSNSTAPILVVKPPQNYANTSVNATYYNASNVQKTISNLGLASNVLLFGIVIPKYLFLLIDVILLAVVAMFGVKHEAPIILALAILVLSGIIQLSLQLLALAILLIYLAYNIEKWRM